MHDLQVCRRASPPIAKDVSRVTGAGAPPLLFAGGGDHAQGDGIVPGGGQHTSPGANPTYTGEYVKSTCVLCNCILVIICNWKLMLCWFYTLDS